MDEKLAAVEARTDAKFIQLGGKIDSLSAAVKRLSKAVTVGSVEMRSENRATRSTVIVTRVGAVIADLAVMVGVLQYGSATFYNGTVLRDTIGSALTQRLLHVRPIAPTK